MSECDESTFLQIDSISHSLLAKSSSSIRRVLRTFVSKVCPSSCPYFIVKYPTDHTDTVKAFHIPDFRYPISYQRYYCYTLHIRYVMVYDSGPCLVRVCPIQIILNHYLLAAIFWPSLGLENVVFR